MGYPKQVFENAWKTLNSRRDSLRQENALRRAEVRRRLPALEELERRMAAVGAGVTKAVVADPDRARELIENLGRESLALQRQREALLLTAGYTADYLAERSLCPHCGDMGYIGARRCSCFEKLLRAEAHAWLGTTAPLDRCSFSGFRLDLYPEAAEGGEVSPRERMGNILSACQRYARDFSPTSHSLLFMGPTGLGKTHLSLAIAGEVLARGYGVLYASVQQLMDRLENEKFSRSSEAKEQYTDNMGIVMGCDLLILDDLGAEFTTSFTSSALYNIINTRITEGKPVIVSTNLTSKNIEERYSQRMSSRLICEYSVYQFSGLDIRFVKKMRA
jgi:DNA replication protein DnaC